jgi:hypothetical protein
MSRSGALLSGTIPGSANLAALDCGEDARIGLSSAVRDKGEPDGRVRLSVD